MGGGLLNLVAKGNINVILNGNPQKTFFKKTYAKYTNFGLQRFKISYQNQNRITLFANSIFKFRIPSDGDMLLDTFFSINLPNIYSPIYVRPTPLDENGEAVPKDSNKNPYCQPYEFKWIENIGSQLIRKVTYLIDGRPIQEYSGHYLYCKSQRDLTSSGREQFDQMTGNIVELNDPANFSNNNGNYPNASWGGLSRSEWQNGIQPSIKGRQLFIPLYLWETFSSYQAVPLVSLYYSRLEVHIECRPFSELFVVRDLNYYDKFINDICYNTGLPCNQNDIFKYYNPPFIAPNFNDFRYQHGFFLEEPPLRSRCLGDISYNQYIQTTDKQGNSITKIQTEQDVFKYIAQLNYTEKDPVTNVTLYCTYAFLSNNERIRIAGIPQRYLVKQVYEKTIPLVQGFHRENVNATGLTVSWMWVFQRSDVVLRNEWSNYSNWPYRNKMPYPSVLALDLSFTLTDLERVNTPYITPVGFACNNNIEERFNPCLQYITGPIHPGNQKEIMTEWGLYCDELERETLFPDGINNYIEKYLVLDGDLEDGIYNYSFNIEKTTRQQPSGSMNMSKFTNVAFEFETIDPWREMIPNAIDEPGGLDLNLHCYNNDKYQNYIDDSWGEKAFGENNDSTYFNYVSPGGQIVSVNNGNYLDFDYNYNLTIMEERFNILEFSGGMGKLLF
ncbi:major capsid protein 2 [Chrysochromulina ericina virus CeV-01B]|uniref:Major capsid protein 2 n=1 Tax=Chrysochromulina ericina virus CeV-01B TaxID=3070830 RepID=A0A0N9QA50_9VIRU|nr:major capsid protein 2 [Chrysochromulina ericina virus]ALH22994.1 major capsid protein 2 [Chrysochromulina ericina virus CeV-01B]|tara:strand:+ start:4225 stop:6237 length:2013 start_codon:yes stop_codon:yes gene_type:complete